MEHPVSHLLQGIDTIIVRVSDINISRDWYVTKLGLTVLFEDTDMKLVVVDTNSATSLTLWQTDDEIVINPNTTCYPIFKTQDAAALRLALLGQGIPVGEIIQDTHVRYFFFYDPDGNVLEACQVPA